MPTHLTVRMAWHDNGWNGAVCRNPEANFYCVGAHSLLSERLARNKNAEIETNYTEKKIDGVPGYIPPCYWSANAFSCESAKIIHVHPFTQIADKTIPETLHKYSVFSWPFRLSFNHSKETRKREGTYPKDLEERIEKFAAKFKPDETIVFFYLNYDNPVSADEYRYALVGCAMLADVGELVDFEFSEQELAQWQSLKNMQNFPTLNWAIQFSCDFEKTGIKLPYQEYLQHIQNHPDEEDKLREMRVLIEENALIPRFKYVAEELDDDRCIYLLYKLRKAISIVQEHRIVKFDREEKLIEKLIERTWKKRGLYPALGNIIDLLSDLESEETGEGNQIVSTIRDQISHEEDLLEAVFRLLQEPVPIPDYLKRFSNTLKAARIGLRDHASLIDLLKKLSLFSLTKFQLKRVVFSGMADEEPPFGRKEIKPQEIITNLYILCEEYEPTEPDLDQPELRDGPIGVFTIDIGMFPDPHYQTRNYELQNLSPASPERLRALIVEYLQQVGADGHCFVTLDAVYQNILSHPLFYKQKLDLNKQELTVGNHRQHFSDRLSIVENDGESYFYLREVEYAEDLLEKVVLTLISRKKEHHVSLSWVDDFLEKESQTLKKQIPSFDEKQFVTERTKLLEGTLRKSFYAITGKPGSGKTQALKTIIEHLEAIGESLTILAPTGKATLRLNQVTGFNGAQTIDMFICRTGYSYCIDDLRNLLDIQKTAEMPEIENLIIDECSMVDLQKLSIIFAMLKLEGEGAVKRVILVGDENQLPPIGYGRPFYDIVGFLRSKEDIRTKHFVRLETNCRQKFDEKILRIADIFLGRNRYYEELLEELNEGGEISEGCTVKRWSTQEELFSLVNEKLSEILRDEVGDQANHDKAMAFNLLLGLYPQGYVPNNSADNLQLDKLQVITPYKSGFFGTLGINHLIRTEYKKPYWPDQSYPRSSFGHSDKIIRLVNWYWWDRFEKRRVLALSNGSIGIVCNQNRGRALYFPDRDKPIYRMDEEENFELAYAITIHKSQGSEFKNVFVIVPERRSLLSKELLYTAFTRSTHKVTVFLQRTERESPLSIARERSFVLLRNTSLFSKPEDARIWLEPEPGVQVKSKIEYIIYRALMEYRSKGLLEFRYEQELKLRNKSYVIHPDFTVHTNGRTYYWEHLGELDYREYFKDWKERRSDYEINGLLDFLVTTDDLEGVKHELIHKVIQDMINGTLQSSKDVRFSYYHYRLYDL